MYTLEQKQLAVENYLKLRSLRKTIRRLEYTERTEMYMQEILKEDNLSYEEAFSKLDYI